MIDTNTQFASLAIVSTAHDLRYKFFSSLIAFSLGGHDGCKAHVHVHTTIHARSPKLSV